MPDDGYVTLRVPTEARQQLQTLYEEFVSEGLGGFAPECRACAERLQRRGMRPGTLAMLLAMAVETLARTRGYGPGEAAAPAVNQEEEP